MNDPTDQPTASEAAADSQPDATPVAPPETLEQAQARADSARDQMLRAHADLENLRRRHERELHNAVRYGVEALVTELLPVKDSLLEGIKAAQAPGIDPAAALDRVVEGTRMTLDLLDKAMTKAGLSELHPQGEPFNPELHQALSLADCAELPSNHVVHVVQTGYRLHDRLVRPAMVVVSK